MKNWGIRSRVILMSLLPATAIAVMLGLYLMNVQIRELDKSMLERGHAIARQLAPACEYGVFSGNRTILESLARSALYESDVRSVTILDEVGRPLANAGKLAQTPVPPARSDKPNITTTWSDDLLSITAPIYQSRVAMEDYIVEAADGPSPARGPGLAPTGESADGQSPTRGPRPGSVGGAATDTASRAAISRPVLGWVNIELSLEGMTAQKNRVIVSSLLITLLGFAIAAVLGSYLARGVSNPILHLADTVRRLGEGRLDTRAHTDNTGEIHTLETGINTMATRLQEAQERLQERVAQATIELRDALAQLESQNKVLKVEMAERRQAEVQMRMLSSIVEHTSDIVCVTDYNGIIQYVNPGFEEVTGYRRDEVLGRKTNVLRSGKHDQAFYRNMWETLLDGRAFRDVLLNKKKDDSLYFEDKTILPLRNEQGRITHFISTGKDISELMRNQAQLDYLAFHDPLTKLPNRSLFRDRLEQAINRAHRQDRLIALLFLDLDRFKTINDSLGHALGDRLLKEVANRLGGCAREIDTVARLGGDEFTIILEDLEHPDQAVMIAQKVLDVLVEPFQVDEREFHVTASIGIALYPLDEREAEALIKAADTAMYHAKEAGRNSYQFYSAAMTARVTQRLAVETQLRRALEREEFVVHYQPIVDLAGGHILGAEALLRWQHASRGLVSVHEFVPIMEDTGLILSIGEWVLRQACQRQRTWEQDGSSPYVAINVSTRQLMKPDIVGNIVRILHETGLPPDRLCLEITESVLLGDTQAAGETLKGLKDIGVTIAMDDFGTGFSSLSYLRRFPVDIVKIDREFIRNISTNAPDEALVETIIYMAHRLGLKVVAEGVETEEQLALLRRYDCDAIQGHVFGAAMAHDQLFTCIHSQKHLS